MPKSARHYPQFNLRMPPDMKEILARRAHMNGRSVTAEVLTILERVLKATNNQDSCSNP